MATTVKKSISRNLSSVDIDLAKISSRSLAKAAIHRQETVKVRLMDSKEQETIELPASAIEMLLDILTQMSQGNAVTIMPVHAELTTQEAADVLNVSRPYLIELLDKKEIPFRKVGTHRRVLFQDIMNYKQGIDEARNKALDELTKISQEMKLGY